MKTEGAGELAERLRLELFQQLGYTVGKQDPIIALAYAMRQLHLDLHESVHAGRQELEDQTRTALTEGRTQIRDYAGTLTEALASELREQLHPQLMGERIVDACSTGLAREVSTALRGHLETQEERLQELFVGAMRKHDEQVLWHLERRLGTYTRSNRRSATIMVMIAACVIAVATLVLHQGTQLQKQAAADFPALAGPAAGRGPQMVPLAVPTSAEAR